MISISRLFPVAPIRIYLVALVVGVALPLLVFVGYLMFQLERHEREALSNDTAEDAQLIARAVDRELQDMATTLRWLVNSPELAAGDLEAFHSRTEASLKSNSMFVIIADADGQLRLNTRVPFGTPLGKTANIPALQAVLETGITEVSNVFRGTTSGEYVFNVAQPLPKTMEKSGAEMIVTQNAKSLDRLISADGLPAGWTAAVLDGSGAVVTSVGAEKMLEGAHFDPNTLKLMSGTKGTIEDIDGDAPQMYGYAQINGWSWKAVVWGPIEAAQQGIITTWRQLVAGGILFLGIATVSAYLVARQLRRPIQQLAEMAERIGKGEIVSPVMTKITEANQVAIALSNASFDRSQAEDRTHLVLHELVHRTKNILTLVQAMMRQLARQGTSMDEFHKAIGKRLQGLGKSIEALAREQWAGVAMRRVIEIHMSTFGDVADRVEARGPDFVLKAEAVQNLGLVLHELATNSVKYGALSVPRGRVIIHWEEADPALDDTVRRIRLTWTEQGGPPVTMPSKTGFGTTIIERHAVAAFGAQVETEFLREGLVWTMVAPWANLERGERDAAREMALPL